MDAHLTALLSLSACCNTVGVASIEKAALVDIWDEEFHASTTTATTLEEIVGRVISRAT